MSARETYLLSSDELLVVAAASGLDSFLMFGSQTQPSREQQIKSVFRLLNDGFFIGQGTAIRPGPPLACLLEVLRCATTVAIAKLLSCEAVPVCIYYDDRVEKILRIIPYKHKEDYYEVSIEELDSLLEYFEAFSFLPVLRSQQIIDSESVPDSPWSNEIDFTVVEEEPVSTFEKFNLSTKTVIGKSSIIQAPFGWLLISNSTAGTEHTYYSRNSFTSWLKGGVG